jgi:tetratricopeptide (TPR) repeat protein
VTAFKTLSMTSHQRFLGIVVVVLLGSCCGSAGQLTVRQECYDPDGQLAALLPQLEANRAKGCADDRHISDPRSACESVPREIERLALVCPNHVPTLMANAVMAHDRGQSPSAQQFLDRIFERRSSQPDAAALRAQIAIEDGNLPFARRFLEQQIRLAPDHAGLLEMYGAALYLSGRMQDARLVLERAELLGAPRWRIAYHLGLLAEAAGALEEARRLYTEAVDENPGWEPAQARLKGLKGR